MKIGQEIDALYGLREEYRAQQRAADRAKATMKEKEEEILKWLEDNHAKKMSGEKLTVSVKKEKVPHVTDWDAVYQYIDENKAFYLLQRRVLVKAYQEILQNHEEVSGIEAEEKTSLSLHAL